ncbi:MAG: hypothetical protein CFE40_01175 [Burkholderiales bacterium PBB1]|nr:MAG: hypothetical protein CFE40_01175 [Burkholderiales bacterium PBB1]
MADTLMTGRMLGLHLLLELAAIIIASLVVVMSWHTFHHDRREPAHVLLCGFLVVVVCDLMHALTPEGMPSLFADGSDDVAGFFWLMGRSFQAATLLLMALRTTPRINRPAATAIGTSIAAVLLAVGIFQVESRPLIFIEALRMKPLQARFEYGLCAANLIVAALLVRRSRVSDRDQERLLALSCVVMAAGGLSFALSEQNAHTQHVFGHVLKVLAYLLLYRATFIASIRAPYEAVSRSEAQLADYAARIKTLSQNLPLSVMYQVIGHHAEDRRFVYVSEASERIFGIPAEAAMQDPARLFARIVPEDRAKFRAEQRRSHREVSIFDLTVRLGRDDGTTRHIHFHSAPRRLADGSLIWDGIATDVTGRMEAEESRRRMEAGRYESQRLEALGTLASGIAHDFNNILASIIGNVSLVLDAIKKDATADAMRGVQHIHKASVRARDLVKQILSFSRQQVPVREVRALRSIVSEGIGLLDATLPASITVRAQLDEVSALVDTTQIQQVVLNLCTNAAQAMGPFGGCIDVGLVAVELTLARAQELGLAAGPHANLWVADNGSGMSEDTQRRAFEPFFTTKPVGSGTGLGLSVVHSIVKTHQGAVTLTSELGAGSRFDIYLPRVSGTPPGPPPAMDGATPAHTDGERVIYVDDDVMMAMMVESLLKSAGYTVTSFTDADLAIDVMRRHPDAFDILVTDFNMPTRSGLDLIKAVRTMRPGLPMLLSTGYVTEDLITEARKLGASAVLEKEHSPESLVAAIRSALATRVPKE